MKSLYIESENIDLTIKPGDRRLWIGVSGHNIPSFEIFTSPDWRGTEGRYFANLPSFRSGNYVEGVRLTFDKGAVTKIEADTGGDFTVKQLSMDRGARRVGEFSLTDKRFSRIDRFMADTLYDEIMAAGMETAILLLVLPTVSRTKEIRQSSQEMQKGRWGSMTQLFTGTSSIRKTRQ